MRIRRVEVFEYTLPLVAPLRIGEAALSERTGFLLKATTAEGLTGWGEAAPLPGFSKETHEQTRDELLRCAARLHGYRLPRHYEDLEGGGLINTSQPAVSFALECAYFTLLAAAAQTTLAVALNPSAAAGIRTAALLQGNRGEIAAKALAAREAGYTTVKLKVGRLAAAEEVPLVHEVRAALGDDIALRLDANRAWPLDAAVHTCRAIEHCNVEYIEEPLQDPFELEYFAGQTGIPYALDETFHQVTELFKPSHSDRANLNEYLRTRIGGITTIFERAAAVVWKPTLIHLPALGQQVETASFPLRINSLVMSSAYESSIGASLIAHYAAAFASDTAAGVDTCATLAEDVLTPPFQAHPFIRAEAVFPSEGLINQEKLRRVFDSQVDV